MPPQRSFPSRFFRTCIRWFDTSISVSPGSPSTAERDGRIDWVRFLPFLALHVACISVIWVGVSGIAVTVCALLYLVRMFAITGIYHRYFAHRAFKTGRLRQFAFAVLGNAAVQRGPLWWAAHHRHHHRHSDEPEDVHSPIQHGFWWSHMGWIGTRTNFATDYDAIPDFARFPELRFLDRFDILVPIALAVATFVVGVVLNRTMPQLGTSGAQMLVWGFVISTIALFHGTCTINSLSHLFGTRRYQTGDHSRNNFLLALITLGEGWHNNHHYYQATARQGFYWWEVDITFYVLKTLSWVGVVHDLKPMPRAARDRRPVLVTKVAQLVAVAETAQPVEA